MHAAMVLKLCHYYAKNKNKLNTGQIHFIKIIKKYFVECIKMQVLVNIS